MGDSLRFFPHRHAGLMLGFILCMGLLICLESSGDPDVITGVSEVMNEVGIWPFAEARAIHLGIESGVSNSGSKPLLTALAVSTFHFFGHGISTLLIFSAIPFMLCIFTVAYYLSWRRGSIYGLLVAAWMALQPSFVAWSSVPSTIPLAAFICLLLVLNAGRAYRWAPWISLLLGGVATWGLSPLVMVALPACWIEGVRRELPEKLKVGGWSLSLAFLCTLLGLSFLGGDLQTLCRGISGVSGEMETGSFVSFLAVEPGSFLLLLLALVAGFRKTEPGLRPLTAMIVTGSVPWLIAGELHLFPLIVLFPSALLLIVDTFADRSRVKVLEVSNSGKGMREALYVFIFALLLGGGVMSSLVHSPKIVWFGSVLLGASIVGLLVAVRSGFDRSTAAWVGLLTLFCLLLPVNLNRIAHTTDRWEIARNELDRLIPQGEPISGKYAHALVLDSDRTAFKTSKHLNLEVTDENSARGLQLETYRLFDKSILLQRREGAARSLFEIAVFQHQMGDHSESRKTLSEILKKDPKCSPAWELLALLLQEGGIEDMAAECYFFALQGDPWRVRSHQQLALLYADQGFFREALYHLSRSEHQKYVQFPFGESISSTPNRR
ncbi:MAG TPA: hypothetical protein DGU45_06125 [Planctomycetes bacterium]|nr:hypothetical protein [Planctomycetota bacterium]HCW44873.1 hypothetical protein [Planctomycetota bacterium]